MTSRKQLVVVTIFAALACTGLHAQSPDMRATIPFDFHAGDRLMPAGEYVIHGEGPAVLLRGADGRSPGVIFLTIRTESRDLSNTRLEFNRYGSEFFLSIIWNSLTQSGRQVLPTAREKELAKQAAPVPAAVTLASSK